MPHIIGNKIMLREYRAEDLEYMRKWCNNQDITTFLSDIFLYPHTVKATESYLNSIIEGNTEQKGFIIAHKDSQQYIGQIDLFHIDWKNRTAEMGMVIGDTQLHNQGIGTEAIKLLQQFIFLQLNLNRLQLEVHDYNESAIACYKKCGFIEEGRLRQKHFANGVYSDIILMSILSSDYVNNVTEQP